VLSFGYKHGVPSTRIWSSMSVPADPHFVTALRRRTGRDRAVATFMEREPSTREFMDRFEDYCATDSVLRRRRQDYLTNRNWLHGGRHRSVMIAERLRRALPEVGGVRVRFGTGYRACLTAGGG